MGKKFLLCAAAVVGVIAISPDLQKELKDKSQQVYWMIMENSGRILLYYLFLQKNRFIMECNGSKSSEKPSVRKNSILKSF